MLRYMIHLANNHNLYNLTLKCPGLNSWSSSLHPIGLWETASGAMSCHIGIPQILPSHFADPLFQAATGHHLCDCSLPSSSFARVLPYTAAKRAVWKIHRWARYFLHSKYPLAPALSHSEWSPRSPSDPQQPPHWSHPPASLSITVQPPFPSDWTTDLLLPWPLLLLFQWPQGSPLQAPFNVISHTADKLSQSTQL